MTTLADILQEARHYLQDNVAPLRQTDAELELYLKGAFSELYRYRPDVFPANGCSVTLPSWHHLSEEFPLGPQWSTGMAYFVAASAELKDDEHVGEDRKSTYLFGRAYRAMGITK